MKSLKKAVIISITTLYLVNIGNTAACQSYDESDYSKIGTKCPEFKFTKVINHEKSQISLSSIQGKALILDFWNTYCVPCIRAMPKLDSMQKEFKEEIVILPIATQMDGKVQTLYNQLLEHKKISKNTLPTAQDTILFRHFTTKQGTLGQYVWIDRNGIIRYYSRSHDITPQNIRSFLNDGKVKSLENATNNRLQELDTRIYFDFEKPLFTNDNGGIEETILYRSILVPSQKKLTGSSSPYINTSMLKNMVQLNKATLSLLYEVAYGDTISHHPMLGHPSSYGKYWKEPILEISDKTPFQSDYPKSMKNMYTYSLVVPIEVSNTTYLQKAMQEDLNRYFKYTVSVEDRIMPCWKLIAQENTLNKVKTKNPEAKRENSLIQIFMTQARIDELIFEIWKNNQNEPPIIDQTQIKDLIDITIKGDLNNINEVKKSLKTYGMDLVKGETVMKVIVIRDPK